MLDYNIVKYDACFHCGGLFEHCDDAVCIQAVQAEQKKEFWEKDLGDIFFSDKSREPRGPLRCVYFHEHCWKQIAGLELTP